MPEPTSPFRIVDALRHYIEESHDKPPWTYRDPDFIKTMIP